MLVNLLTSKAFLLYYKRKNHWGDGPTEDDVMLWTPKNISANTVVQRLIRMMILLPALPFP
jgi:hypothetical protein